MYLPENPEAGIAPCPNWLTVALTGKPANGTAKAEEFFTTKDPAWWRDADVIHPPKRHQAMVAAAGYYLKLGLHPDQAVPAIRDVWRRCCSGTCPGHEPAQSYTWDRALACLDDVYGRYEPGEPRGEDPDDEFERAGDQAAAFARDVARETHRLRVGQAARDKLRADELATTEWPEIVPLPALLAEPEATARYRVDKLWPRHGRVILAAAYKAGKTTLRDNLVRSLVDGVLFLGHYTVEPVTTGNVVILDVEMSRGDLRRWLRDQNITHPDRVHVVPLRGRAGALNLLDEQTRARWVADLRSRGAAVVVLDCLRPVLDALGLEETREAGRFLVPFDTMLAEADVDEALVVHHMGHTGERSRGDSRLRDWPDAEWRLIREAEEDGREPDAATRRYIAALGRDVDEPEALLSYDEHTRRLTLVGGNRKDARAEAAIPDVLDLLGLHQPEGLSGRAIEGWLVAKHRPQPRHRP